jgi:hypothetical protein
MRVTLMAMLGNVRIPLQVDIGTDAAGTVRTAHLSELPRIIELLDAFLWPVHQAAARGERWSYRWTAGGPWDGHRRA